MHRFRELRVYQKALKITRIVRKVTSTFPREEQFVLAVQFKKAIDSVALNISEGAGNPTQKEFARFLTYSIRSGYECIGCIDIALINNYIKDEEHRELEKEFNEIIAMLVSLKNSLLNNRKIQTY